MLVESNIRDNDYHLQLILKVFWRYGYMDNAISSKIILSTNEMFERCSSEASNLSKAQVNREYTIKEVKTNDEEIKNFLFTLGCYNGEIITVLSVLGENYVISVKDARYSIDKDLAETIIV
jgi:ferrous iron transport protein A